MDTDNSELVSKILKLSGGNRYEVSNAVFHLMDHMQCVDIPPSIRNRKLSVKALYLFADEHLKYDYDHRLSEEKAKETERLSSDTDVSVASDTDVSVVSDTDVSVVSDTDVSVVSDTDVSVVSDTDVSVVSDTDVSVVSDTDVPVVSDTDVSVVSDTDVPNEQSLSLEDDNTTI